MSRGADPQSRSSFLCYFEKSRLAGFERDLASSPFRVGASPELKGVTLAPLIAFVAWSFDCLSGFRCIKRGPATAHKGGGRDEELMPRRRVTASKPLASITNG